MRQIGAFGVAALIALRLGIGWHFYKEGIKKFRPDSEGSVGFLQGAQGPLAERFKSLIPDRFGEQRLTDVAASVSAWSAYKDDVARQFEFDDQQMKKADAIVKEFSERLRTYLKDNEDEIDEYFLEVRQLQKASKAPERELQFQRARMANKERELRSKVAPWLAEVRALEQQLQDRLMAVRVSGQQSLKSIPITDRGKPWADEIVKYAVLGIGVLLMLGLFTRLAGLLGMGFLLTVMSTQPPWLLEANTQYFYYQMVEVLALLVLVAMAAGRYGGLDYLIHSVLSRGTTGRSSVSA